MTAASVAAGLLTRPRAVGGGAATPGALMFIGGLALVYWALSGWGLFGLGDRGVAKQFGGVKVSIGSAFKNGTGPGSAGGGGDQKVM